MQTARASSHGTPLKIGQLCVGGDWACADGDLETLGYIATQLAASIPEPLHCKLLGLAELCRHDPETAVATWIDLKELVLADGWPRDGRPSS